MPEFGTQVYWHNIPACPPPWKDEEERARTWRISQHIVGAISDQRHLLEPPRAEILAKRLLGRFAPKRVHRYWGIVCEPYLSPLNGLNMVMSELQVRPITIEEAKEAVNVVCEDYNAMTQQQQKSTQSGILSQGGVKTEISTQQSNTAAMDLREAPLLQVVKILCASRGLEVSSFSRAELRSKGRLGVADLLPRRRVIMAFDRSKPKFVFATAVSVKKKKDAEKSTVCYIQLVAPTSNPVPWRQLLKREIPYLPPNECVVVAVQRHHDDEGYDDDDDGDEKNSGDDGPYLSDANVRSEVLLGDNESEKDDLGEEGDAQPRQQHEEGETPQKKHKCEYEDKIVFSDMSEVSESSGSTTASCRSDEAKRKKFVGREPIFTAEEKLQNDPLFETPVAVLRKLPRKTRGVHDWIQRLINPVARKRLYAINY
ncbi:hypothetical protein TCDM_00179 [Trypanosoma cruzi Dm28c]|uniref:Uncharacterized protein n=1 Tax=Trypanosoma cruzi Dm28c TaxID=1416333 RepID=V5C2W6_TRYCR|nr:hypothetical protein TCDM_00179 [Trypanosoma cruzi Dm28c]KAF8283534.1 hypothetical protein TcBrA4_0062210 [Trypanosoma cruzi]